MQFQLSTNSPRNTSLHTPEGQEIYRIVTPQKLGQRITTISKVVPNTQDNFAHLAEIVWPIVGKNTLRFQGNDVPSESYLRPDGPFKSHRVFEGPDGRSYRWDLGPFGTGAPELRRADETKQVIAKFHPQGSHHNAYLEIAMEGEHMMDQIVITFILVEKLRRDREHQASSVG